MAKRKKDVLAKLPDGWPTPPFVMCDRTSVIGYTVLILHRSPGGWVGVGPARGIEAGLEAFITDYTILDGDCDLNQKRRYYPHTASFGEAKSFAKHIDAIRIAALRNGATPEAIRHLHNYQPFTKEEVDKMAKKLAKKKAPAPKKAAAKKAPAKKKGAAKKTETSRVDERKITIVKKENPYREGSARAASFDALTGAKTVEDYKSNGGATKYISRWEKEGLIKLS